MLFLSVLYARFMWEAWSNGIGVVTSTSALAVLKSTKECTQNCKTDGKIGWNTGRTNTKDVQQINLLCISCV
jgi:hypothetical protein